MKLTDGMLVYGDYHGVKAMYNGVQVAGATEVTVSGSELFINNTYNDPMKVLVCGNDYQEQTVQFPSPYNPSPLQCVEKGTLIQVENGDSITIPEDMYSGDVLNVGTGVLTQAVRKHICTGNEAWTLEKSSSEYTECFNFFPGKAFGYTNAKCSHLPIGSSILSPINSFRGRINNTAISFCLSTDIATNVATFKAYLAAQYAAGTPVILLYELAEASTLQCPVQRLHAVKGQTRIYANGTIKPTITATALTR